jgi:hypothetical protein
LGRAIAKGDIDPVDLAQTFLDAIDAHPFTSRIYTIVTHDRALAEAHAASERARLGQRKSALDGRLKPAVFCSKIVCRPKIARCCAARRSWGWSASGKRICPNWPFLVWVIIPERRLRLV